MIDCDNTNIVSNKTIKALGGIFEREEYKEEQNKTLNVYWIDVKDSIEKYKSLLY